MEAKQTHPLALEFDPITQKSALTGRGVPPRSYEQVANWLPSQPQASMSNTTLAIDVDMLSCRIVSSHYTRFFIAILYDLDDSCGGRSALPIGWHST